VELWPKAPIPRLWISISIRIAYPDKKWNKLNNVGATCILVVRISIRINFVLKGVRIESLSEPFYPDADEIRTAFSKIRRQKDITLNIFSNITMFISGITRWNKMRYYAKFNQCSVFFMLIETVVVNFTLNTPCPDCFDALFSPHQLC